jgi:hypothetical protein
MFMQWVPIMKELVSIADWEEAMTRERVLVMVSKSDCDECEAALDGISYLGEEDVHILHLDNPESSLLRIELAWLGMEVDVVPFWRLFVGGEVSETVRGPNLERVRSMISDSE